MQFRRGDTVRVALKSSYRHELNGLIGVVRAVYDYGVDVELGSDPAGIQKVIGTGGVTGPAVPGTIRRMFQFNELEHVE